MEDGCLVCPNHKWAYDADGSNVAVPYADQPCHEARLRTYPTVVRNNHLMAWYHPDASVAPLWDVPDVVADRFVECVRMERRIRTGWQELAENWVEMPHFRSVHWLSRTTDIGEIHVEGPFRRVRSTQWFNTPKGELEARIESQIFGPGVVVVGFTLMGAVTLVSATTPLAPDEVMIRFTIFHEAGNDVAAKIGAGFGVEVSRQLEQEIPIWENKRYQLTPALVPDEQPLLDFRHWASQFYPTKGVELTV